MVMCIQQYTEERERERERERGSGNGEGQCIFGYFEPSSFIYGALKKEEYCCYSYPGEELYNVLRMLIWRIHTMTHR